MLLLLMNFKKIGGKRLFIGNEFNDKSSGHKQNDFVLGYDSKDKAGKI